MTRSETFARSSPLAAPAAIVLALAAAALALVWTAQLAGYPPCELCLKERLPFYAALPLAAATLAAARLQARQAARAGLLLLAALFVGSAAFGAYHAGVEWGWWPGPTECTGSAGARAASNADFLRQLQAVRVVRCDAVAIRILGLSLAGWNALGSLVIAAVAATGLRRG